MIIDLKNQKCQACAGNTPTFDENQISEHLAKLDDWSVNDEQKMIYKKFIFKTFKQALAFTNKVNKELLYPVRLLFQLRNDEKRFIEEVKKFPKNNIMELENYLKIE